MPFAVKDNSIQEVGPDEIDYEIPNMSRVMGSHINLIPLQSAVQGPRLFYGARFFNQAMPVVGAEAPLVQNLDPDDLDGASFDEQFGASVGALRADRPSQVLSVDKDNIILKDEDGSKRTIPLYNNFIFNRKSSITHRPMVKPGDVLAPKQLIAASNYTDDNGTLAMGLNARVALVPYKGHSMDDAVVISESFAKRLKAEHTYAESQDFDEDVKGGLNHYKALFPDTFNKDQLSFMDEQGVVKPGTILQPGDPYILATKPKSVSSLSNQMGRLSKVMRFARGDASRKWEGSVPATVTDVARTKTGVKVVLQALNETQPGDKLSLRAGQKGVVSKIIPDEHMPRTLDGQPMEVLLNHLGVPSRANSSAIYEILLGKVAAKQGKAVKVPAFTANGEDWYDTVQKKLDEAGTPATEELFDPVTNRKLERPVTVGNAFVLRLHHTSESKHSARGQGSYTQDEQPAKGGGESAQSKRRSGLETVSMLSAGAYANLREGATLSGSRNDDYWRSVRSAQTPKPPGEPFVWKKFRALLSGAGLHTKDHSGGKIRLGPMTDRHLDELKPVEVKNGGMVDFNTLEPTAGGLFDTALVGNSSWGAVPLPFPIPNPAMEKSVRRLLGMTEKEMREVLAGRAELPQHLR